jgi:hypothetical protein
MLLFGVRVGNSKFVRSFVKESNYRFGGGDGSDKGTIFIDGKITPVKRSYGYFLIFNVRLFLFNLSIMKPLIFWVFTKGLKKHGYKGIKPEMANSLELYNELGAKL